MKTELFDYGLPSDRIAQQPLPDRAQARLLVVRRGSGAFEHRRVADLPALLNPGDLLVVNDTRVIPARLRGRRSDTGGRVEVLLLEELEPGRWNALLRARRARPGLALELASGRIAAEVLEAAGMGRVTLRLHSDAPLAAVLEAEGETPLPPYIKRGPGAGQAEDAAQRARDRDRYQTVYARVPGAVAAPTAGLHFTAASFEALARRGIGRAAVTLHVGAGTFQPVTADRVELHRMEDERYTVPADTAARLAGTRAAGGRIVAVGSTVVRTLETVAARYGTVRADTGRTDLFITPPYAFRAVDVLLTNFHLPRSTLLMMVSAFAGLDLIRGAYAEAIRMGYRFYSYGDAMLIL